MVTTPSTQEGEALFASSSVRRTIECLHQFGQATNSSYATAAARIYERMLEVIPSQTHQPAGMAWNEAAPHILEFTIATNMPEEAKQELIYRAWESITEPIALAKFFHKIEAHGHTFPQQTYLYTVLQPFLTQAAPLDRARLEADSLWRFWPRPRPIADENEHPTDHHRLAGCQEVVANLNNLLDELPNNDKGGEEAQQEAAKLRLKAGANLLRLDFSDEAVQLFQAIDGIAHPVEAAAAWRLSLWRAMDEGRYEPTNEQVAMWTAQLKKGSEFPSPPIEAIIGLYKIGLLPPEYSHHNTFSFTREEGLYLSLTFPELYLQLAYFETPGSHLRAYSRAFPKDKFAPVRDQYVEQVRVLSLSADPPTIHQLALILECHLIMANQDATDPLRDALIQQAIKGLYRQYQADPKRYEAAEADANPLVAACDTLQNLPLGEFRFAAIGHIAHLYHQLHPEGINVESRLAGAISQELRRAHILHRAGIALPELTASTLPLWGFI